MNTSLGFLFLSTFKSHFNYVRCFVLFFSSSSFASNFKNMREWEQCACELCNSCLITFNRIHYRFECRTILSKERFQFIFSYHSVLKYKNQQSTVAFSIFWYIFFIENWRSHFMDFSWLMKKKLIVCCEFFSPAYRIQWIVI